MERIGLKKLSLMLLAAIVLIGFSSCGDSDDDNETAPPPSWQGGQGDDSDSQGGSDSDGGYDVSVERLVKANVSASAYYEDFAYHITMTTTLEDAYPGHDIEYGLEFGYDGYQYQRFWNVDGQNFSTEEYILVDVNGSPYAGYSLYLRSYIALKNKEAAGEPLFKDEQDLMDEITDILGEVEFEALLDFCARVFVDVDGERYYVETIKRT